jgi:hypothetical protein
VPSPAVSYRVRKEVYSHPECGLSLLRRIVVHLGIFPPIAQVRLIRVVDYEPAIEKDAESLRRLAVVSMDFRHALRKLVHDMIDGMIEWNFDQRLIGKEPSQLAADRDVHAIVVVGVEKPSLLQVSPEGDEVTIGPVHVTVPGHIEIRNVPKLIIPESDDLLLARYPKGCAGADGGEQVWKTGGIGVPVAAPVVVQPANGHHRARIQRAQRGRDRYADG